MNDRVPMARGALTIWVQDPVLKIFLPHGRNHNDLLYGWGYMAARQLGFRRTSDQLDYSITSMYIEFENVADPDDAVSPPTVTRDAGIDYYNDLLGSSSRDFLRVQLTTEPLLGIQTDYEDFFAEGEGNKLTFFAQSAGTAGVHGKPFSAAANSKVFGAALVATPVPSDRTRDIVFNRGYLDAADQVVKQLSSQVGMTWDVWFE